MAEISFLDRLCAVGLGTFPASDRAELERTVKSLDEAAARVRLDFAFAEEPSNVFRLSPAVAGKDREG